MNNVCASIPSVPPRRRLTARVLALITVFILSILGAPETDATPVAPAPGLHAAAEASIDSVHAYKDRGPHAVSVSANLVTTFYYPADIESSASPFPVVLWGNGTFALPFVYKAFLEHLASYGFIVAAANTPFANFGGEMLAGLDTLTRLNNDSASQFYEAVDLNRVAASGHSQGGAGAINASRDARVTTVIPIQPGPLADISRLHSPLLLLTGSADLVVPPPLWVLPLFYANAPVPAVYASARGVGHFASVFSTDGGPFREIVTAWLRAELSDDAAAQRIFRGENFSLQNDPDWVGVRRNQAAQLRR